MLIALISSFLLAKIGLKVNLCPQPLCTLNNPNQVLLCTGVAGSGSKFLKTRPPGPVVSQDGPPQPQARPRSRQESRLSHDSLDDGRLTFLMVWWSIVDYGTCIYVLVAQ